MTNFLKKKKNPDLGLYLEKRLCQFLNILIIYDRAKNLKKLISR